MTRVGHSILNQAGTYYIISYLLIYKDIVSVFIEMGYWIKNIRFYTRNTFIKY